jgi:hypothetical protein
MVVNIVISKYNENIEWTKGIKHKITIYDKSSNPIKNSIVLKNRGREGETFLYHIVNNYYNLDDITVFLQGNPFDHLQILFGWNKEISKNDINNVVNKINTEISDNSEFASFYQYLHNVPNYTNHADTRAICNKYFNSDCEFFTIAAGAQFIVPKRYILSRPISFWKRLHEGMYNETIDGYGMEQLWYYAFTGKMNNKFKSHDIEKERCILNMSINHTPYSYI